MLHKHDIAFNGCFIQIHRQRVILDGILFGIGAHRVDRIIQQIAFARCDLTDRPAVSAGEIVGQDISVFIGRVGLHQLAVLIHAVNSALKRSVSAGVTVGIAEIFRAFVFVIIGCHQLRHCRLVVAISVFGIQLVNIRTPFFQGVVYGGFGCFFPCDRYGLILRNNIAGSRVFFGKCVGTYGHILEGCLSAAVRNSVHIHLLSRSRSPVQAELMALDQAILGCFRHNKIATLQKIAEGYDGSAAGNDGDGLRRLRHIALIFVFGHGIGARLQVLYGNAAVRAGDNILVHAIAGDIQPDTADLAVLGLLDDLHISGNFLIHSGKFDNAVIGGADSDCPLGLPVGTVVCREYRFLYRVLPIGDALDAGAVTAGVGRADQILCAVFL